MSAEIVTLAKSNFRDIPTTLREIADSLERGEYGNVRDGAVILRGSEFNIFHVGEGDPSDTHLLLCCGARKMEHAVIMGSGGYRFDSQES